MDMPGSRVPNTATVSSTRPARATPFPRHGGILRPAVFAVARRAAFSNMNPPPGRRCRWRERAKPDRGSGERATGATGQCGPIAGPSEKSASVDPRPAARSAGREESRPSHREARSQRKRGAPRPSRQVGSIGVRLGRAQRTGRMTRPARRKRVAATITSLADPGAFPRPSVLRRSPGGRTGSREADPRWGTPPACGSVRCNRPCRQQLHRCMPDGHSADGSWCSSGYLDGVPAAGDVHESARRDKRG